MKAHFSHDPGELYSWKTYHLEDVNENATGYGNHN